MLLPEEFLMRQDRSSSAHAVVDNLTSSVQPIHHLSIAKLSLTLQVLWGCTLTELPLQLHHHHIRHTCL